MIKLNKLSRQACKRFFYINAFGRNESRTARRLRILRNWDRMAGATDEPHGSLKEFTQEEVAAADVIISTIRFLIEDGCEDVEKLLRKRLETMIDYD